MSARAARRIGVRNLRVKQYGAAGSGWFGPDAAAVTNTGSRSVIQDASARCSVDINE
ncbi:hypothetical protein BVI434_800035 [Burkholderia vietnamiensis]|nr:hypothetical protein BVI434_800035 [Burkholderia vietnamiensis]